MVAELTSTANPRVKRLVRLRRRRDRDDEGVTLVEGYDELVLAMTSGGRPLELYYAPSLITDPDRLDLVDEVRRRGGAVFSTSASVFSAIAYRQSPDGWLGVLPTPSSSLADLELGANPLVLVAEAIEKPGNLGAMLRTAEALGVDAVIAASPVTDWANPNVVRASKGTLFAVPTASASSSEVIAWLREHGMVVLVTTPQGDVDMHTVDMTGPTAVVIGSESSGVEPQWYEHAFVHARIATTGTVNSLNASVACAMTVYEATRQRAQAGVRRSTA